MKKILVTKNPAKKLRSPPKSMGFHTFEGGPESKTAEGSVLPPRTIKSSRKIGTISRKAVRKAVHKVG